MPIRADLCRLGIGLAYSLVEAFPNEAEAAGLLALLLLHDARRDARLDASGRPVPFPEQERTRWDHDAIRRATELLERSLALGSPGPVQTEAAIAAVHCKAGAANETDWHEIAALYALLESFRPTPAVRVNRSFAVAKADGGEAGLKLLEREDGLDVRTYPYFHLVRGAILEELGRLGNARASLVRAAECARNAHEAEQLRTRIARLDRLNSEGRE